MTRQLAKYQTDGGDSITLTDSVVRNTISNNPAVTDREVMLFAALCKAQKLNPFIGDVSLVKYGSSAATMVVGKEVFTKRAMRNPRFKGFQAGVTVATQDGQLVRREGSMRLPGESIVGGWAKCYMDGYQVPFFEEASFDEYAGRKKDGRLNRTWSSRPGTMIRKVALVHVLREAMPEDFQGMYDEAEMAKDAEGNATMVEAPQGGYIDPEQQAWEVMPDSEREAAAQPEDAEAEPVPDPKERIPGDMPSGIDGGSFAF